MTHLDNQLIKVLAWQRLQQLLPKEEKKEIVPVEPVSTIRARAVLYPLSGKGKSINMCYRTLNIGTGEYRAPFVVQSG
jgi:hypothetical protein